MEWTDEAIVIGVRRHGETSAVVELLTRARGRHRGLVRGGLGRRRAGILQPGNRVHAVWRARLDEHLGVLTLEPLHLRAEALMGEAHAAFGLTYLASLTHLLAEREPNAGLYEVLDAILDAVGDPEAAGVLVARFELALLAALGYGLELDACAVTGGRNDLIYVSPRTGKAVSAAAGEPYAERLLPLPSFLSSGLTPPDFTALEDAFRLTGHFLASRVMEPRGLALPDTRGSFIAALRRRLSGQNR